MKIDLKNRKFLNSSYSLVYIILSYVFTIWYEVEFIAFEIKTSRSIVFFIIYTIFVVLTLYFLKASNSNIAIVIIGVFSIIHLKDYSAGPIQILLNNKFNDSLQYRSILTFEFIAQIMIVIFNLAISFYTIYKLHGIQENKIDI